MQTLVCFKDDVLVACPLCRGTSVQTHRCVAEWRQSEGGDGVRTVSSKSSSAVTPVSREKVRGYNDVITAHMRCEECDGRPTLVIQHHRGATIMYWEVPSDAGERTVLPVL